MYVFCNTGLKTQNHTKNVWTYYSLCQPKISQCLKTNTCISFNVTRKELKLSLIIKGALYLNLNEILRGFK